VSGENLNIRIAQANTPLNFESLSETQQLEKLTQLDSKIEKKTQSVFYKYLGIGKCSVKKLRTQRFAIATSLTSRSTSQETLEKVSSIMTKEINRISTRQQKVKLPSQSKLQDIINNSGEIKNKIDKKILAVRTISMDNVSNATIDAEFDLSELEQAVLNPQDDVNEAELDYFIEGPPSKTMDDDSNDFDLFLNKEGKFNRCCRDDPDFTFTMEVEGRSIELHGAGADSNGDLKATGAFGRVFFGNDGEKDIAVKVLQISPEISEEIDREVDFSIEMEGSSHVIGSPRVVYITPPGSKKTSHVCIFMDKIDGGDLIDLFNEKKLPPKTKIRTFRDAANGLNELHKKGIVHRDIKPDNILFDKNKNVAKIADLGGAMKTSQMPEGEMLGTPIFYAPEVMRREKQTPASDIYSFGIMMHQLSTKTLLAPPEECLDNQGNTYYECPGRLDGDLHVSPSDYQELPEDLRQEMADLVNGCLKLDPKQRVSSEQLSERLDSIFQKMETPV
jgi:hypothetical protein